MVIIAKPKAKAVPKKEPVNATVAETLMDEKPIDLLDEVEEVLTVSKRGRPKKNK